MPILNLPYLILQHALQRSSRTDSEGPDSVKFGKLGDRSECLQFWLVRSNFRKPAAQLCRDSQ